MKKNSLFYFLCVFTCLSAPLLSHAQLQWTQDGNSIYEFSENEGVSIKNLLTNQTTGFIDRAHLIPEGKNQPLSVQSLIISDDNSKILLFTNTKRVWRENTRGDYWIYDIRNKSLKQLGKGLPESSLKFAKFSPDSKQVAYVSLNNLYIEDLDQMKYYPITSDGSNVLINGTFDWAYEEEFGTKDGFRWSPDGHKIAFWKQDAHNMRKFNLINNTDSLYSFVIPIEYPKVGQTPSATSIWIYDLATKKQIRANIPGSETENYITRMDWQLNSKNIFVQQLNRKQTESRILTADANTGSTKVLHTEIDSVWIDIKSRWTDGDPKGWDWINQGREFIWVSEKDHFRKIYAIDLNGKERLITHINYDVIEILSMDHLNKKIYFTASPLNSAQKYLYSVTFDGKKIKKVTPDDLSGTNNYTISPNGALAIYSHSQINSLSQGAIVSLPQHQEIHPAKYVLQSNNQVEFFNITTEDQVELNGWMLKPKNFNPQKKYPVVFYVYGEPASSTVKDDFSAGKNRLYKGDMANDGYIYISIENRGTPAPKGRNWRKAIYKNIGIINTRDQAMGAKEILKWSFVDSSRVAVWGWSGGGASTLNLLGQYPDIYKTGISIAPVTNQLLYDNIYQERYMGLPQEDLRPFEKGSAVTYAKNVKGNLMLIHGTGDDNVHYQNLEVYINELIKHNIYFQMMSYPNRTHSINEYPGTNAHISTIFTTFLKQYCPPGGR